MMSMVYNWPAEQVDMIVVTDGSRILGHGDLGIQDICIAIGKLDLYVAAAGINPQRIWLGGTPNQTLLAHCFLNKVKIQELEKVLEPLFYHWKRSRDDKESFGDFSNHMVEMSFTLLLFSFFFGRCCCVAVIAIVVVMFLYYYLVTVNLMFCPFFIIISLITPECNFSLDS